MLQQSTVNFYSFGKKILNAKNIFYDNESVLKKIFKESQFDSPPLGLAFYKESDNHTVAYYNRNSYYTPSLSISFIFNSLINDKNGEFIIKINIY